MAAPTDVLTRIDEIEGELRGLSAELHELRALVTQAAVAPAAEPAPPGPGAARGARRRSRPPVDPAARLEAAIAAARIHLSEGERSAALDELERAIEFSRTDPQALRRLEIDPRGHRPLPVVRAHAGRRARRDGARRRARGREAAPAPRLPRRGRAARRPRRPRRRRSRRSRPPAIPAEAGPDARARPRSSPPDWDLLGPRGFAIIGGAVTAFGIILLFVLAANRGWITPAMRVAFGACVSAAAVGVAFWVRSRYGQLQMSLGAAGAGIAGGYATLAAAAARYDLVPDWLALPLAGGLAAVAVVIAIAWSSETVAAIGLLGAALAPALQAIDTGLSWPSVAFAVIILAATVVLAVPRRWHELLIGIGVVVGAQVALLALDADASAGAGTTAVLASFVLVVLAAGVWLQLVSGKTDLDPLASSFVLAAVGLALLLVRPLWDVDRNQGYALAGAAVVWAGAWLALRRVQPALALVLGVSSLSLAAVATADLLSGTSLAITWAAEALLLSFVALRVRDARLQATALVYCAITAAHVLLVDAPPKLDLRGAGSRDGRGLGRCAGARAARGRHPRARRGGGAHGDRAPRLARSRPRLARGASRRAAGGPRPRRRRSRHLRGRDPAHRLLVPHRSPRGHDRRRDRRCRRRGDLVAAWLRRARRGVARLGRRRVRHRHGLRCARVRGRGDPPLVRRLGADRRLGRRARRLLRLPAPLPWRAPHRRPGGRRRPRARRSRGRHRPHLAGRRRARVDLDRLAAARADACLPRPLGERVPHSAPSRSRDAHVGARRDRAPRQRVARRPRRDVARGCLRRHGGRPRPALAAPAGAAALARRLDRRRAGRHSSRIVVLAGIWAIDGAEPMRYAIAGARGRGRPRRRRRARVGRRRRAAISSPSPGRPRSSR